MQIPESDHSVQALIDKYHESKADKPRPHLGASLLGHPCDRWLWLSFRWAVQPKFPGRILRLFRRGQNEEATIISDLRAIGVDVRRVSAQHKVDFGSHVSGSLDAIIDKGVPEAPKAKHVAEFKTHSKKSFDALVKDGVEKSKPEHFVQMQVYMHGTQIDRALYVAVCKDDDRIYTERVKYDKETAEKYIRRGHYIALSDRMPPPISTDASWYQCKFCDAHKFCHEDKKTQFANCRTCAHATAKSDSTWHCARWDDVIPLDAQRTGCESHVLHPDLVPWERKEGPDEWTAIYMINGKEVANGAPANGVYSSREILANPSECAAPGEMLSKLRQEFDGRIVG
ncbi:MAG: hypothetical protein ACK42H_07155 [Planctomycetota bacterium]|jgi:hypothetical protein